jgi:hypothetical protein
LVFVHDWSTSRFVFSSLIVYKKRFNLGLSSNGQVYATGVFSFHVTCGFDFSNFPNDEQVGDFGFLYVNLKLKMGQKITNKLKD